MSLLTCSTGIVVRERSPITFAAPENTLMSSDITVEAMQDTQFTTMVRNLSPITSLQAFFSELSPLLGPDVL